MRFLQAGILAGVLLLAASAGAQAVNDQDKTYRQDDPNPPALQGLEGEVPNVISQRAVDQCVEMARALRDFGAEDLLAADPAGDLAPLLKALRAAAPAAEPGAEDPKTPFGDMVRILATDLDAEQYERVARIAEKAHRRHGPSFPTEEAFEARLAGEEDLSAKLEVIALTARDVANELMFISFDPDAPRTDGPSAWSADLCRRVARQETVLKEAYTSLGPFGERIGKPGPLGGRAPTEQDLGNKKLYDICLERIGAQRAERCPGKE